MVKTEPFPPEACDNEHAVVVAKTTSQRYCTFHGLRIEPAASFISSSLDLACVCQLRYPETAQMPKCGQEARLRDLQYKYIYFLTSYRPFFPVSVFFGLRNSVFFAILRNLKGERWRSSRHVGSKDLFMSRMPRL